MSPVKARFSIEICTHLLESICHGATNPLRGIDLIPLQNGMVKVAFDSHSRNMWTVDGDMLIETLRQYREDLNGSSPSVEQVWEYLEVRLWT